MTVYKTKRGPRPSDRRYALVYKDGVVGPFRTRTAAKMFNWEKLGELDVRVVEMFTPGQFGSDLRPNLNGAFFVEGQGGGCTDTRSAVVPYHIAVGADRPTRWFSDDDSTVVYEADVYTLCGGDWPQRSTRIVRHVPPVADTTFGLFPARLCGNCNRIIGDKPVEYNPRPSRHLLRLLADAAA